MFLSQNNPKASYHSKSKFPVVRMLCSGLSLQPHLLPFMCFSHHSPPTGFPDVFETSQVQCLCQENSSTDFRRLAFPPFQVSLCSNAFTEMCPVLNSHIRCMITLHPLTLTCCTISTRNNALC